MLLIELKIMLLKVLAIYPADPKWKQLFLSTSLLTYETPEGQGGYFENHQISFGLLMYKPPSEVKEKVVFIYHLQCARNCIRY